MATPQPLADRAQSDTAVRATLTTMPRSPWHENSQLYQPTKRVLESSQLLLTTSWTNSTPSLPQSAASYLLRVSKGTSVHNRQDTDDG